MFAESDLRHLVTFAATNPMTYFTLVEVLCRRGLYTCHDIDDPAILLRLPFLFVGDNQQQLIPTWTLTKAYASAFASWVKAYIMVLPDPEASASASSAAAVTAGGGQPGTAGLQEHAAAAVATSPIMLNPTSESAAAAESASSGWASDAAGMLVVLDLQLIWLGTEITQAHVAAALVVGEPFAPWRCEWAGAAVESTPSSLQLLLLLWLGRAMLLAGQRLLAMVPTASKNSSGSTTSKSSSRKQQQQARSQTNGKERGSSNDVILKEEADTSQARSRTSSSGIGSGTTCADTAAAAEGASGSTSSSSSSGDEHGTAPVLGTDRVKVMRLLTVAALRHHTFVVRWQEKVSDGAAAAGGPATDCHVTAAAAAGVPATAGGPATEGHLTAAAAAAAGDSGEGSSSRYSAATSAVAPAADDGGSTADCPAASAAAGSSSDQLPKRLAKMPTHSLPAAVTTQLYELASAWPAGITSCEEELPEDPQQLQQLLQDLLDFEQVLLLEVPSPIGCNNPGCVNLEGESEAKNALKRCSECKVGYCSRECQVAHWKVHKMVCGKLQKQGLPNNLGREG